MEIFRQAYDENFWSGEIREKIAGRKGVGGGGWRAGNRKIDIPRQMDAEFHRMSHARRSILRVCVCVCV